MSDVKLSRRRLCGMLAAGLAAFGLMVSGASAEGKKQPKKLGKVLMPIGDARRMFDEYLRRELQVGIDEAARGDSTERNADEFLERAHGQHNKRVVLSAIPIPEACSPVVGHVTRLVLSRTLQVSPPSEEQPHE